MRSSDLTGLERGCTGGEALTRCLRALTGFAGLGRVVVKFSLSVDLL